MTAEVDPTSFVYNLDADAPARRIASERFVTPGHGETLLAKSYQSNGTCLLERIDLVGTVIDPARPLDCDIKPVGESDVGIIARDYASTVADDYIVLDPTTLHERWRWPVPLQLHAIVGHRALLSDRREFLIVDLTTHEEVRVHAPEAFGHPGKGLVSPDSRYVAIEYRSPQQIMDLWLLDLDQLVWLQAPSMPVHALIKRAPPVWTADGRIAVVGDFGTVHYRHLLAVWEPDHADWAVREVDTNAHFVLDHLQ